MKMNLKTLGELTLENSSLTERLPLLLLSYLVLEGKTHRQRLADLFWIHQPDAQKRFQGLSETLYRLKKARGSLITINDDYVSASAITDVETFEKEKDIKAALALYKGPFLANLERNKRLQLGEELTEWVLNKRESLQTRALNLWLEYAEELAFASQFEEAANMAWQAFTASTAIAYPNQEVYKRTHTLLLAAEQIDRATTLKKEVVEIYGQGNFLFDQPFKARAYVTHTFNLRPQEDELIDRDKDLRALLGLMESSRLITIYGPPGVGKTSLAQVLARTARGQAFVAEGIHIAYFESLPQAASFDSLMRHVSEALGIAPSGKALTLDDLSNFIADKPQLLILDNVEHVAKEAARIVKHLHDACKELRIIVTSRQHLKLNHETIFSLKALSFPTIEAVSLETIHSYAAVNLFERDAKKYGFQVTEDALGDIISVCQMVEGLPLALKLAAAWTNTLTPRQIVEQLGQNLDLLSLGTQDTDRHTSIRATFSHSIALLPQKEANSLVNLGIFENGFTLEAAQGVIQTDMFMLRQLVEKSLLRFNAENSRYGFTRC